MRFVRITYDGRHYNYKNGSDLGMDILGTFLAHDVRECSAGFRDLALDEAIRGGGGNLTTLEKVDGMILLSDTYSEEEVPTELAMSIPQFVQLLDEWQQKVWAVRPQEVTIKNDNGRFILETSSQ